MTKIQIYKKYYKLPSNTRQNIDKVILTKHKIHLDAIVMEIGIVSEDKEIPNLTNFHM